MGILLQVNLQVFTHENKSAIIINKLLNLPQNIAAYGQNISEVIEEVSAIEMATGKELTFSNEECKFTYRHSRFKIDERGKYCIVSVTFKLAKGTGKLETSYHERKGRYGSLEEELQSFAKSPYTMKDVMEAVIRQRTKRLPSLDEYGSCGSVFENPVVTVEKYNELAEKVSDLQSYPFDKLDYSKSKWDQFEEGVEYVKIPAGRLLDELGWKGRWIGNAGVSEKHALCVVTRDDVKGSEVLEVVEQMRKSVKDAYGVELEAELNII